MALGKVRDRDASTRKALCRKYPKFLRKFFFGMIFWWLGGWPLAMIGKRGRLLFDTNTCARSAFAVFVEHFEETINDGINRLHLDAVRKRPQTYYWLVLTERGLTSSVLSERPR